MSQIRNFKLLTFNAGLFQLNFLGMPIIKPVHYIKSRLKILPKALIRNGSDVIGLQEVFKKKHQSFLIEKLKPFYPYWAFKNNKSFRINNGLMIFSKFPIIKFQFTPFINRGTIDERLLAIKGILETTIKFQDIEVDLINLHPTSGGFLNTQDSSEVLATRENQILQATEMANNSGNPAIIVGDLNAGPEIAKSNYNLFNKFNFTDTYQKYCIRKKTRPRFTWDAKNLLNKWGTHSDSISQRVDHIFFSKKMMELCSIDKVKLAFENACVKVKDNTITLSDHFGLNTTFTRM